MPIKEKALNLKFNPYKRVKNDPKVGICFGCMPSKLKTEKNTCTIILCYNLRPTNFVLPQSKLDNVLGKCGLI